MDRLLGNCGSILLRTFLPSLTPKPQLYVISFPIKAALQLYFIKEKIIIIVVTWGAGNKKVSDLYTDHDSCQAQHLRDGLASTALHLRECSILHSNSFVQDSQRATLGELMVFGVPRHSALNQQRQLRQHVACAILIVTIFSQLTKRKLKG